MKVRSGELEGCLELRPQVHSDERGFFVKPFQRTEFVSLGLPVDFHEVFYSRSQSGVIRGLHFQRPPQAQAKLVYCVTGKAFDVVVDLRRGSRTYGCFETFLLDGDDWKMIFVPVGFAHGFAALSDDTVMAYAVTSEYDPKLDSGIRWDSVLVDWPWQDPIISARDASLEPFSEFSTPFERDD